MSDHRPFRILALDGGGLRGVYGAAALSRFESLGSLRLADHFDLIAGTSTGGIMAIALGLGIPASEIHALYKQDGPKIFRPKLGGNLRMLAGAKHSPAELEASLRRVFQDRPLGQSKTRLCIPAVTATTGSPRVFKTSHHADFKIDHKLPAWRVALATSAAPFFLPGAQVDDSSDVQVDGGLWANNPAMVGVMEAITYLGQDMKDLHVLSIGTGAPPAVTKEGALHPSGKTWVPAIFNTVIGSQSKAVDFQLKILARTRGLHYHRLEPKLNGSAALDDASALDKFASAGDEAGRHAYKELEPRFFGESVPTFTPVHGGAP